MKTVKLAMLFALSALIFLTACKNDNDESNEPGEQKESLSKKNQAVAGTENATGDISLNALPSEIKEYVAKNHPGYTISKAAHDPLCGGGDAIDVLISKPGGKTYSLIFLPDGKYVQLEEDLDITMAPAQIMNAVKAKYAAYTPAMQIEKLTLANKSTQYLLDLSKDSVTKEVIFSSKGEVVCEN